MKPLRISAALELPPDAVTQTLAAIARKGAGKTYFATKLAELMSGVGAQIIAIDPVGNWYGLRLGADGKSAGIPIYVFGGEHGDVPLSPESGRRIAAVIVEKRISVVLDISAFRKGERERFAAEFAEEFFHRKKSQRSPVHLFIEEAQKFVPQQAGPEERKMLGAFEDIVRLGRNYGIGATLVSQRPQSVNKEVLSQVECLVTLQINGVHERKAIDAWVSEHGLDRGLLGELPGLAIGEAFVWSPSWLRTFKRVKIDPKRTFDASATPTVGQQIVIPGKLSPVDIESLQADMAAEIERAKADDPKELRRRIAELERELRLARERSAPDPQVTAARESEIRKEAARSVHQQYGEVMIDIGEAADKLNEALNMGRELARFVNVITEPKRLPAPATAAFAAGAAQNGAAAGAQARRQVAGHAGHAGPGEKMPGAERKVLTVLAQYPQGRSKVQVAVLAGYAHTGGGFNNSLSSLRTKGWIEGGGDRLTITSAGLQALGDYQPLPTGADLQRYWMAELGKAEREILQVLCDAYPRALSKEETAARTPTRYEPSGGGYNNALSRLRTLELIEGRGELRASEVLFG